MPQEMQAAGAPHALPTPIPRGGGGRKRPGRIADENRAADTEHTRGTEEDIMGLERTSVPELQPIITGRSIEGAFWKFLSYLVYGVCPIKVSRSGLETMLHVVAAILRTLHDCSLPATMIRARSPFAPALRSVSIPYELGWLTSLPHSGAA